MRVALHQEHARRGAVSDTLECTAHGDIGDLRKGRASRKDSHTRRVVASSMASAGKRRYASMGGSSAWLRMGAAPAKRPCLHDGGKRPRALEKEGVAAITSCGLRAHGR